MPLLSMVLTHFDAFAKKKKKDSAVHYGAGSCEGIFEMEPPSLDELNHNPENTIRPMG